MNEMRLLVDIGNSRIKWLWARGGALDAGSVGQGDIETFRQACREPVTPPPATVRVSSVAGTEVARQVAAVCGERWGVQIQLLQSRAEQGGVRNGYRDPGQLGVDRWLAIVGAVAAYGRPVIVWDLGTAATLDGVDGSGRYVGGWILPGPGTMLDALARRTRLPVPPDLADGHAAEPGKSTAEAIRRGVLAAQIGALNLFTEGLAARSGEAPRLVVAGGAATAVLAEFQVAHTCDPLLVFRGMLVD